MKNVNLIVMGKTGAGKSTLINAVLEEDLAPVGMGMPVTKQNAVYTRKMLLPVDGNGSNEYRMTGCKVNLYDTVGLEIDSVVTNRTLDEIKRHIEETKAKTDSDDIHFVWFCVNDRSSRFEPYEMELIRKLSIDYEIPFIIVITQCLSDKEGDLEKQIHKNIPEILRKRILAREYAVRGGKIPAYGVSDLLKMSVNNYKVQKVELLEKKLFNLDEKRTSWISSIEKKGNDCIKRYSKTSGRVGILPGGCIPVVHGICIKMIAELNGIGGFYSDKGGADEIFAYIATGIAATPLMAIPVLSTVAAQAYVEIVGENCLKLMLKVIDKSTNSELQDNALMMERLRAELIKLKK